MKSVDVRLAPVEQHPGTTALAVVLPHDPDQHRPERAVLLVVDQVSHRPPRLRSGRELMPVGLLIADS
jgi:hypothetical protein